MTNKFSQPRQRTQRTNQPTNQVHSRQRLSNRARQFCRVVTALSICSKIAKLVYARADQSTRDKSQHADATMLPAEAGKGIPWNQAALARRAHLSHRWNSEREFTIPFYKFWDIFQKEPDLIKSALTFFWSISIPLSSTTGTLGFLGNSGMAHHKNAQSSFASIP